MQHLEFLTPFWGFSQNGICEEWIKIICTLQRQPGRTWHLLVLPLWQHCAICSSQHQLELNLALYFWLCFYLSVTAQPVNMRLTHMVLFRFFSASCPDKAQGNRDFPEERLVPNNSFSQQRMFSDAHQYLCFHRAKILHFQCHLVHEHPLSQCFKTTCKTLDFYICISHWLKFLCAIRQHHIANHPISRLPWIFEICTSAMIYEIFV